VLLALALPSVWFALRPVEVLIGGYTGASSVFTAIPLLGCCLLLLASGFLYSVRPRRLWSLAALLCSAPWVVVGGQILLATDPLSRILVGLTGGSGVAKQIQVVVGPGAYLLLSAGLLGLVWAGLTGVQVHRRGVHASENGDGWRR
jgi:hypothetical protein